MCEGVLLEILFLSFVYQLIRMCSGDIIIFCFLVQWGGWDQLGGKRVNISDGCYDYVGKEVVEGK